MDSMVSIGILNISAGRAANSSPVFVEDVSIGIAAASDGVEIDSAEIGSERISASELGSLTSFSKSGTGGTVTTGSNACGTA